MQTINSFWKDDGFPIDQKQHTHEFQNDEDNNYMKVKVVQMANQTSYQPSQYVYARSWNKSSTSKPQNEELHQ